MHIAIMSKFETTFRTAVLNAERDVLVDQIRANPQMNLSELGKLATGGLAGLLGSITIADLIGGGGSAAPARKIKGAGRNGGRKAAAVAAAKPAAKPGRKPKAAAAADADGVDTRTAEGRAAYDGNVLTALKAATGPQSASDLTSKVGGSPLQIRTALARLIEAGSVNWSGRARGTRYTAK
jgi:hypothetical protein